ncbi:MAG: hypothetical protein EU536_00590 [Promethearchaeota archaeon]|nr:MAG: hypothetical protein EU536_00590 [Candidatus Lokiarchaeota archaeon]
MVNRIEHETHLILQEYSCDYDDEKSGVLTVYLSITPQIHYQISLNFNNYPDKPEIVLPTDLQKEVGNLDSILTGLSDWDPQKPLHVVELLRELEGEVQRVIFPNEEMEEVMMEFNAYMVAPFKLHVIFLIDQKAYEFDIIHKKPDPPSLVFDTPLEQILKPTDLTTLALWPRTKLLEIVREISHKIENRTRIIDELKQLDTLKPYQKTIKKWNGQGLNLEIRIELETGEYCIIEITLSEEYPLIPPAIELKSLSNPQDQETLNELLLQYYNRWQRETRLCEVLNDIQLFLQQTSTHICNLCRHYKCPQCQKPISQLQMRGISGEFDCIHRCQSCGAIFHKCCWKQYVKQTRKCPKCLAQQTILY